MDTNLLFHETILGDSIIRRHNRSLRGTRLTAKEMRGRLPRRFHDFDILVSGRGDLTVLFWLYPKVNMKLPVYGTKWRKVFAEILSFLPPAMILMKQDWILDAGSSGKYFRRTFVGLTLCCGKRSKSSDSEFGFFSKNVWEDCVDVDFSRMLEHFSECICNRLNGSGLCYSSRIVGKELEGMAEWFLTLNGEAGFEGLGVEDYLTLGDVYVDLIGILEEPEDPLWLKKTELREDMVVKTPDVHINRLPLVERLTSCNMIFTQLFTSEGQVVSDPGWRAVNGGPVNRPVLITTFNIITWSPRKWKLKHNYRMIKRRLTRLGAFTKEHVWTQPWFLVAFIPGLAGELPNGESFLAYSEAAAQYVMPPASSRK